MRYYIAVDHNLCFISCNGWGNNLRDAFYFSSEEEAESFLQMYRTTRFGQNGNGTSRTFTSIAETECVFFDTDLDRILVHPREFDADHHFRTEEEAIAAQLSQEQQEIEELKSTIESNVKRLKELGVSVGNIRVNTGRR